MNLVIHPAASDEEDAEADFYGERSADLGLDFIATVRAAYARIRERPELYAPAEDAPAGRNVRNIPLDRFPFRVVYWVRPADVVIPAVAHTSRRPGYWKNRLRSVP